MEKKSLGRGLEDISRTFMSMSGESKQKEMTPVFLSKAIRNESCSACHNFVEEPFRPSKCKIFCFESEKYGVSPMDSIKPNFAEFCRYFKPAAGKDGNEAVSIERDSLKEDEGQYEIVEMVTSNKRIAFEDDKNVQKNMKRMLSQHLKEGYNITRIELEKWQEISEPRVQFKRHGEVISEPKSQVKRHEEVSIFKKTSLSS